MSAPENPAAFPCTGEGFQSDTYTQKGMTLRDWFAGQALAYVIEAYSVGNGPCLGADHMPRNCAVHAYRVADAMLAERAKGGDL